jgi:hypothetical protein
MFVPKWLLFILFAISIGSVIALLAVLSTKPVKVSSTPAPTAVIQVSSTPGSSQAALPSASASALPAAADWKKYSSKDLSVAFDYPNAWFTKDGTGEVLLSNSNNYIEASNSAVPNDSVRIVVKREKKPKSTYTLADYKKANPVDAKSETDIKVADYSGTDRTVVEGKVSTRTIVFLTKNYIYSITISPSDTSLKAVVEEFIKSVEII